MINEPAAEPAKQPTIQSQDHTGAQTQAEPVAASLNTEDMPILSIDEFGSISGLRSKPRCGAHLHDTSTLNTKKPVQRRMNGKSVEQPIIQG